MKITKLEERIEEIALSLVAMGYMSANIEIPYTKKELMERIRGSTALYEKDVGKLLSLIEIERKEAVKEFVSFQISKGMYMEGLYEQYLEKQK